MTAAATCVDCASLPGTKFLACGGRTAQRQSCHVSNCVKSVTISSCVAFSSCVTSVTYSSWDHERHYLAKLPGKKLFILQCKTAWHTAAMYSSRGSQRHGCGSGR